VELVGQRLGLDCRNVAALDDQLLDAGHVEGVAHDRGNGASQQAHLAHGHPKDAQLVDTRVLHAELWNRLINIRDHNDCSLYLRNKEIKIMFKY